jgi:hypothetical protein
MKNASLMDEALALTVSPTITDSQKRLADPDVQQFLSTTDPASSVPQNLNFVV